MKTVIDWIKDEPKDWGELGWLPEFECDRLEKGDILSFFITLPTGESVEYFTKVTKVDICLSWRANTESDNIPVNITQYVTLKG